MARRLSASDHRGRLVAMALVMLSMGILLLGAGVEGGLRIMAWVLLFVAGGTAFWSLVALSRRRGVE